MVWERATIASSFSYWACASFGLRSRTQLADGGAKVGSEGLFVEDDERKEERSESSVEGGETVNWDMAAASFLTGSMGGLPRFRVGAGLGHGEDSGVGSGVVEDEVELLLSPPRKPTNCAARWRNDLGRAP